MPKKQTNEAELVNYKKCAMSKAAHMGMYIVFAAAGTAVLNVFYKNMILSLIIALFIAPTFEREFAKSRVKKRKKLLRTQFCDMLEAMSVASRAGNNELKALESAYSDLKMTYNENADIIREMKGIIDRNRNGIPLRVLFKDFGERSGVDDIKSFGEIYEIIEGRSDRFADIIKQTQQIISDKIEIEEEIETVLTAPKNENKIMLVMPVLLVSLLGGEDGGFLAWLYAEDTKIFGMLIISVCVGIFIGAYLLGQKMTDIDV
ncbi:MAG: hypothetical protein NC078_08760 [Ruminococcus sp.]|nr:hypothetical protein [Ruminococcus sp.]